MLESTLFPSLNDHLRSIVGKFIVIQCDQDNNVVYFSDEVQPSPCDNSSIINLSSRIFQAGFIAVFATALGKENMSGKRCNWCNLSAKKWSLQGHHCGEFWMLEMIENVQQNVELNNMPETLQNLKGVTNRPLIDAIPVSNYILPILHNIIGRGNSLLDAFLEWIEVLDMRQVQA